VGPLGLLRIAFRYGPLVIDAIKAMRSKSARPAPAPPATPPPQSAMDAVDEALIAFDARPKKEDGGGSQ
jgi:hypothetical protein